MCLDRTRRSGVCGRSVAITDAAPVCRKACTYDLVGVLEDLELGRPLRSVSVRPLVPPADLAGNRGLASPDLRMWESRSDFHANCCWRRRLQIGKW
jgi:hypothetical protein